VAAIQKDIDLGGKTDQVYRECIQNLSKEELKVKEEMLLAKLTMADEQENPKEIEKIMEELKKTQKMIMIGGKSENGK